MWVKVRVSLWVKPDYNLFVWSRHVRNEHRACPTWTVQVSSFFRSYKFCLLRKVWVLNWVFPWVLFWKVEFELSFSENCFEKGKSGHWAWVLLMLNKISVMSLTRTETQEKPPLSKQAKSPDFCWVSQRVIFSKHVFPRNPWVSGLKTHTNIFAGNPWFKMRRTCLLFFMPRFIWNMPRREQQQIYLKTDHFWRVLGLFF